MPNADYRSKSKENFGFHTPGMLKIIADVHRDVDEHRARNGQAKWNWDRFDAAGKLLKIIKTGWIATLLVGNGHHPRRKDDE